jgi:hypothetical protein
VIGEAKLEGRSRDRYFEDVVVVVYWCAVLINNERFVVVWISFKI